MNLLLKSFRVYLAGIYLRLYKYAFDKKINKKIRLGKAMTGRRINHMSKKYLKITEKFNRLERNFIAALKKYD